MSNLLNIELVSVAIDTGRLANLTPGVYHEVDTHKAVLVKNGLGQEDSIVKIEPNGTIGNPHHTFEAGMCAHSDTGIWVRGTKQVFIYDRKEWEEKGFPLPLHHSNIMDPNIKLFMNTFVCQKTKPLVSVDPRSRLWFDSSTDTLFYAPLDKFQWQVVTKMDVADMLFLPTGKGDYCILGDKFVIQGLNKQHVYIAEDIYKILSDLDPRITFPKEKCVSMNDKHYPDITFNTVHVNPFDVQLIDTRNGQHITIQNTIALTDSKVVGNQLLITTQGVIVLPEYYQVNPSQQMEYIRRRLKAVPGAVSAMVKSLEVAGISINNQAQQHRTWKQVQEGQPVFANGPQQQSPFNPYPPQVQQPMYQQPHHNQRHGMCDFWARETIEALQHRMASMEKDIMALNNAHNVQRTVLSEVELDIKRLLKLVIDDPYISIDTLSCQLGMSRNRTTTLLSVAREYDILSRDGNSRSGPIVVHELDRVLSELNMR